jgi:hypothetical protein
MEEEILSSQPSRPWTFQILGSAITPGAPLRVPLAVFFCEAVRQDVEAHLEVRQQFPLWESARQALDDAGRPIRLVPLVALGGADREPPAADHGAVRAKFVD